MASKPITTLRQSSPMGNLLFVVVLTGFMGVSLYGALIQNYELCLQSIFLAFIPFILWSAQRRSGSLDFFAPDVGLPLAYVAYLYVGTVNLDIHTQFGLFLPWILWVYYIIGLVAYLAGVGLSLNPGPSPAASGQPKRFWEKSRFLLVSTILFLIGLLARLATLIKTGVPILHANDESARVIGAGGILGVLALCLEASFECYLLFLLTEKASKFVRICIVCCMLIIGLNAVATTNRTALLRVLLAAVVVFHYAVRRFKFTGVLFVGLFAATFASAMGTFRDVSNWGEARIQSVEKQGFTDQTYWLLNGYEAVRLPTETFYMMIQEVPSVSPYTYGTTSFASFAQILPGHRPGPSEIVKDTLRLRFTGFGAAATILAPMWLDGGVLGITVGMFLFGFFYRWLYQRMLTSHRYGWVLVYAWFAQNAFKAIKDDVIPELGFAFVIVLFLMVDTVCRADFQGVRLVWPSLSLPARR